MGFWPLLGLSSEIGSVGTANGTSTVRGVTPSTRSYFLLLALCSEGAIETQAVGTAAGSATVLGIGAALASAIGTAAGTSAVLGVGQSAATAVGTASGSCSVRGVPRAAMRRVPDENLLTVPFEDRVLRVTSPFSLT